MSNSKESYNNVELSQEELGSLEGQEQTTTSEETPKEATQENSVTDVKASNEADSRATNPEGSSDNEQTYGFEIDGKEYSISDVEQWKKDSDNRNDWQKSNTEKAQQIAGVGKFLKKFNEDKELQSHIKDYFDNDKEFDSYGLNSNFIEPEETVEQVENNPYEERLNKLEEAENSRIIDQRTDNLEQELSGLEGKYPDLLGTPDKVMNFLDFSEKNSERYRDSNGNVSLSNMLREYSFDYLQEELGHYKKLDKNNSRNSNIVVDRSEVGARETITPKKFTSWKDINPYDEDLKQYFDE